MFYLIEQLVDWVRRVAFAFCMVCIGVMVVCIGYEVVMRYAFNAPTIWVNELSLWLGGMLYLVAGIETTRRREHLSISFIRDVAPPRIRLALDTLGVVVVVLYCSGVIYGASREAIEKLLSWETFGTAWDPPIPAVLKPLILVVLGFVALQSLLNLWSDVRARDAAARNTQ